MSRFLTLDLMPLLAAVLAALSCALLGNFLVLRRLSLMGDAISHSVLPGIAAAFVITQSRHPVPMLLGAAVAALLTVLIVEIVKRLGRVEPGAAMGVTFSVMFALGVVLIERAARSVDLDADCVLYGQLETLASFAAPGDAVQVPHQVITLAVTLFVSILFVAVLYKELRISAFDPGLSTSVGVHAGLMHTLLMALVAAAAVASFEAVGSILVIAMLIAPAATARMLTDRLRPQILVSMLAALAASAGGYFLAVHADRLGLGLRRSLDAAGMITVLSGLIFALAAVFSPTHGVVARTLRRRALSARIILEDLLAALYRAHEAGDHAPREASVIAAIGARNAPSALAAGLRQSLITRYNDTVRLTDAGLAEAADLVRRHRLWETYLVDRAGLRPDHAHQPAEMLEHARAADSTPIAPAINAHTDPHGRVIPPSSAIPSPLPEGGVGEG